MIETCRKKKYAYTKKVGKSPFKTLKKAKAAEKAYYSGKSVGFTAKSSLKSMGRVKRSSGCYVLGPKYR
jgi:hypothetical protein